MKVLIDYAELGTLLVYTKMALFEYKKDHKTWSKEIAEIEELTSRMEKERSKQCKADLQIKYDEISKS